MTKVTFHLANGDKPQVHAVPGQSVMKIAVAHDLPGIVAECGGVLTCATCHVHVPDEWYARFPPAGIAEQEMLEAVDDPQPSSRLSCQLFVSEVLDGLQIIIPQS